MTGRSLPRRVCTLCGNEFAMHKNGTLRRHRRRTRQGYRLDWCPGGTERQTSRHTIRCVCCGELGPHAGLRLITRCYNRHRINGTIEDFAARHTRRRGVASASWLQRRSDLVRLITEGMTNDQIAVELLIGVDTVKSGLKLLFRDLGANNRAHAVAQAYRHGLLSEPDSEPEPDVDATVEQLAAVVLEILPRTERQPT